METVSYNRSQGEKHNFCEWPQGRGGHSQAARTSESVPLMPQLQVSHLNFFYSGFQALKNIHLTVLDKKITAFIGPSGCGKTTLLRCMNRMHDFTPGVSYSGQIILRPENVDLNSPEVDPIEVRMRIGMLFQKPNPFPKSIFENVVYGLRVRGIHDKQILEEKSEKALRAAALWDEVKDKLKKPGTSLSGGQQQRLCLARTLATEPRVLLMDEPTSALDPISTAKIEELIMKLKEEVTIVIVTHNMQQALRVSDETAFFLMGELVEQGPTRQLFMKAQDPRTQDYVGGKYG